MLKTCEQTPRLTIQRLSEAKSLPKSNPIMKIVGADMVDVKIESTNAFLMEGCPYCPFPTLHA